MIKNIEKADSVQKMKKHIFVMQYNLRGSEKQMSLEIHLIFSYLAFLPLVSIMFTSEPFIPEQVNLCNYTLILVFRAFLFTQLPNIFNFDSTYMLYGLGGFLTLSIILLLLNLPAQPFSIFTLLLRLSLDFFIFFVVPFMNYFVVTLGEIIREPPDSALEIVLKSLVLVEIFLMLLYTILYLFLKINPFRKNNITCNYNNNPAFYGYLLDVSRALILALDSPLAVFPIISLVLEFYKREVKGGSINQGIKEVHCNTSNLVVSTHLAVIFVALTGEKLLGFCLYSLFLIGCVAIGVLRYFNRKYEKQLPQCGSTAEIFYDFYYQLLEDMKKVNISGDDNNLYSYYFDHCLFCKQKGCRIKAQVKKKDKISLDDITNLIGKKISLLSDSSPPNEVMLDIWNFQQGKKNAIRRKVRNYSLQDQFIIEYLFYLMSYDNYESEIKSEDQDNFSADMLQKEVYQALIGFGKIYEELIKTNPHFQVIIENMLKIRENTASAKQIFSQLIKSQELNYYVISIYFIFCNYFFDKNFISSQIIAKLKKMHIHNKKEDIHDSSIPTFLFNRQTSNIEDLNIEALRYMRARKAEIKRNILFQFFAPPLNLQHLISCIHKSEEEGKILFFKKLNKQRQKCYGRIQIQTLELNSIQYAIMRVYKKNTSKNQLQILTNEKFKLIAANCNQVRYSFRGKFCVFKVEDGFQQYIYENKESLQKMKFTKIQIIPEQIDGFLIEKDSILANHKLISLKIAFCSLKERSKPRTSYTLTQLSQYNKNPNSFALGFMFTYEGQNEVQIIGKIHQIKCRFSTKDQLKKKKNNELYNDFLRSTIEFGLGMHRSVYSKGIKSYRLFEGELYNIDLEDRQKYNELFGSQGQGQKNQQQNKGCRVHYYAYISITILISIGLFVVSLLLIIRIDEEKIFIEDLFETTQELNFFTLQLNRIIGIMRDAENSLYDSYHKEYLPDIIDSYNAIQKRSDKILFDAHITDMQYENSTYNGTLNQLTEVILSQIHQFIETNDLQKVSFIHDSVINNLISRININQNQILETIDHQIWNLELEKDIYLFCIFGGNIIFYLSLILLAFKVQEMVKEKLLQILLMSDTQSKTHLQMVEKLQSVLLELKKSTVVNVQSLSSERTTFPNRIKPKKSKLDIKTVVFFGIVILFLFSLNLVILLMYKLEVSSTLSKLDTMLTQGASLMSIYLKTTEAVITIDFSDSFSQSKINSYLHQIDESLSLIENERMALKFSNSFTDFINVFFFEDSCSEMIKKGIFSNQNQCDVTCEGFKIQAPFRIGASSYFRYLKYYLTTDLHEAYAATGIFSEPFRNVFSFFSIKIQQQGQQYIESSFSLISSLNGVLFLLVFLNFSISTLIVFNINRAISTVKQLAFALNFSKKSTEEEGQENLDYAEKNDGKQEHFKNQSQVPLEDIDD